MFTAENILDFAILIMLIVMIVYCFILNKRLQAFSTIKEEMADIIAQLNASTMHAQNAITDFKNIVVAEEQKLTKKLKEASEMADELDMINQTGSNLADRIEKGLTSGKDTQAAGSKSFFEDDLPENGENTLSDKEEQNADDKDNLRDSLRNVR